MDGIVTKGEMMKNIFIIPEFGNRHLTEKCVKSIRGQDQLGVIWVGNDGKPPLGGIGGIVDVLDYPDNVGYVKNVNRMVRAASVFLDPSDILFLLNSDMIFGIPDSLKKLAAYARENDVIVGPTIVMPRKVRRPHRQFVQDVKDIKTKKPTEITMISGCSVVLQQKIWEEVGGFDERFTTYFSDDTLCIEARKLGYPTVHLPDAIILHQAGATINKAKDARERMKADKKIFRELYPNTPWDKTGDYNVKD